MPIFKKNIDKIFVRDSGYEWTEYVYVSSLNDVGLYTVYVITIYPEDKTWSVKEEYEDAVYFDEYNYDEFYEDNKVLNFIIRSLKNIDHSLWG